MVQFVNDHEIQPVVDSVFTLDQAQQAIEKMERGEQFGKIVLAVQ